MTSSIFITKNLNLLYLSVQALDPYSTDKIDKYFPRLSLVDLFDNRENSLLRYNSHLSTYNVANTILLANTLFKMASALQLQSQIKLILEDISQEVSDNNQYLPITQNYIARFKAEYSVSIEPYLVGKDIYANQLWIKKLSFLNLFLLSQLTRPHGVYTILVYINKNAFN